MKPSHYDTGTKEFALTVCLEPRAMHYLLNIQVNCDGRVVCTWIRLRPKLEDVGCISPTGLEI